MALLTPHHPVPTFWMEKQDDFLLDNYSPFAFIASPAGKLFVIPPFTDEQLLLLGSYLRAEWRRFRKGRISPSYL